MQTAELIMVTANNNNKFYSMAEQPDGTFHVRYGRVGQSEQHASYPMSKWNAKYNEKIRKGYKDVTALRAENPSGDDEDNEYKPIENKSIASLVRELLSRARNMVRKNYRILAVSVTPAMVDEAQAILDSLSSIKTLRQFNDTLTELFSVIPRSMGHVTDYLAHSADDFPKIIQREQDLLDTMAGQVVTQVAKQETENVAETTILEANGITMKPATKKDKELIRGLLGRNANMLDEAWVVTNKKTQKAYNARMKKKPIKELLLWHGSRTENWWSILCSGLKLRPSNVAINGKMFGYGIYFAPSAQKSLGYTSLQGSYWAGGSDNHGYMAVMEVAYGTPLDIHSWHGWESSLTKENLAKCAPNADCVHAHAGQSLRNDEIIVYDEAQVTIKYLVRLRR